MATSDINLKNVKEPKNFLQLNKQNLKKFHNLRGKKELPTERQITYLRRRPVNLSTDNNVKRSTVSRFVPEAKKDKMLPRRTWKFKLVRRIQEKDTQTDNEKSDQCVQTRDSDKNIYVKLLDPSPPILKALEQRAREAKKRELRKFEKHQKKLEIHLTDLNEFLERGAVSRRKKQREQVRLATEKWLAVNGKKFGLGMELETLYERKPTVVNTAGENIKTQTTQTQTQTTESRSVLS